MHKLLERQLRRHLGDPSRWTPGVEGLVAAIDETYRANDEDRLLIERSLDLSSHELLEANAELQRQVAERLQAEEFLRRSEEDLMRAMERLRETDRFRAQFVNSAAHELNTPITPIRLELALLRASMGGAATPDQRVSLDALDRNVARIEALVGDLLEAARFQGGGVRLLLEQRALRDLAQEAVESYRLAAREAGVALTADLACDAVLPLDPKRVGQVLGNLLSNALKFTPRGGGICVALREIDGEEYLHVRLPEPDVAILRGSIADE
ncbi:MAG TPA: histidine kinase dimerization/phospho-acceptor domain-containing protein, partial [Candidatus Thermoplasmatota archaeon]|nr:histidine kinase dimerization/phospho-acceptor domain-containing protein [Candidatus Thermoplasmatota archaeon]